MPKVANELLSDLVHRIWIRWVKYLFSQCVRESDGLKIPTSLEERWLRQINTPYKDLPNDEGRSDREIALEIQSLFFGDAD